MQSSAAIVMQVLEAKRAQGGAASHSPQAAALQLYAVINAQSNLVKTQVSLDPMVLVLTQAVKFLSTPANHS